jgi:DNA processing protein
MKITHEWSSGECRDRLAMLITCKGQIRALQRLMQGHQRVRDAVRTHGIEPKFHDALGSSQVIKQVQHQLALADSIGARWLCPEDAGFPTALTDSVLICMRGVLPHGPAISVVGTRKPDAYGRTVANALGCALGESSVCVVSGAAAGVDAITQQAALSVGGTTVAVLGTGLLARRHAEVVEMLDRAVQTGGGVISEYLMQAGGAKWTFLERNRLIAELSLATIVVQAPVRSGALNTARHAVQRCKPVYAVPGDIIHPLSGGTNALLADGSARLFSHPRDVADLCKRPELHECVWPARCRDDHPGVVSDGGSQVVLGDRARVLRALKKSPGLRYDELVLKVDKTADSISEVLLELEMLGQVRRCEGDGYRVSEGGM